ncbi:MAG: sugar ABC transporter ATP-binding protein [Chloroflexota bacterium]
MESTMPVLELRGVTRRFPGVVALDGVDFSLRAGEVHALLGENGAGKSTLIKIIGGAVRRDGGELLLDGTVRDFATPSAALEAGIAVIYQELVLCPHLSVAENVLMGHLPRTSGMTIDWPGARAEARRIFDSLGVSIPVDARLDRLSTAQQQMVEIAKALSRDSRILVLDEPSAVLGQRDLEHLFAVVRRLRERGVAIVYISHRLEEIFEIADRVTVLKDGRLAGSWPVGEVSMTGLVRAMTGRDMGEVTVPMAPDHAPVLLEARGLSRTGAFHGVSLEVKAGEIVGVAGLSGSGRTELLRALFGADAPDGGEVRVDGKTARFRSPAQAMRLGLGFLPEDRKTQGLLMNRDVAENITLASLGGFARAGLLEPRRIAAAVREQVSSLRIACRGPRQLVATLSGGNQQKVVLGRWLTRKSRILLFDEPTRGVDVGAKEEIYRLIHHLASQGAAVLVVSSELKELFQLCTRIVGLREGRLVGEFHAGALREEDIVDAMLLGEPSHGR